MKRFTVGDIHGGYIPLLQCLERAGFDHNNDQLICLGDIADGWPFVYEVMELLMSIPNCVVIKGNHDEWLLDWLRDYSKMPQIWIEQGGRNSLKSYNGKPEADLKRHKDYVESWPYYFLSDTDQVFLHGGIWPRESLITEMDKDVIVWNRDLAKLAMMGHLLEQNKDTNGKIQRTFEYMGIDLKDEKLVPNYKEVYLGHSTVSRVSKNPIHFSNVILMDTGGGWEGVLSIMDIDTKEVWQSDPVEDIYKGVRPRN